MLFKYFALNKHLTKRFIAIEMLLVFDFFTLFETYTSLVMSMSLVMLISNVNVSVMKIHYFLFCEILIKGLT